MIHPHHESLTSQHVSPSVSSASILSRLKDYFSRTSSILWNESLDQTGSFRRRAEDQDPSAFRASSHGVNFPTAILLYLIAQLIGGIWWAATYQSKVEYLALENARMWQKIETHDLQLSRLDSMIRAAVKEALQDLDYQRLRNREKGE